MEYYPRITDRRSPSGPAHWIMPLESISHNGITGLVEGGGLSFPVKMPGKIPETFYGRELAALATGSDKEVIAVSEKCGLLVSPFRRVISAWQQMERVFTQTESPSEGKNRLVRLTADPQVPDLQQILEAIKTIERATDAEADALHDSILLTESWTGDKKNTSGVVVSLSEIRATATRLHEVQKVIRAIGEGVSVSDLSELVDRQELPSFPIQRLRYIEYCLRDSGLLGISLTLVDAEQSVVVDGDYRLEDLEVSVLAGEAETDALRQWNMLSAILDARPKEFATLTEAVAWGLRNLAIENRKWAYCDKCGNVFPLTPGKMRKVKKQQGTYCSDSCRNATAQKRYRERQKHTDPSTH